MLSKVYDEIAYLFPKFNRCAVELWECVSNFMRHFMMQLLINT